MTRKWRKSIEGWWFEVHASSSPAERFGEFASLVATWQSRRHGDQLPTWGAFDIPDFRGWYGKLLMTEEPDDGATLKLFGTELVPLFGQDFTSRRLAEAFRSPADGRHVECLRAHFAAVTSGGGIGLCSINFTFAGKEYVQADILTLPLVSRKTGAGLALSVVKAKSRWDEL